MGFLKISRHRKKHLILECLINYADEYFDDPPHFEAMSPSNIKEGSKYDLEDKYSILNSLVQTKDVSKGSVEGEWLNEIFSITDKGRNSYFEEVYLNKIWWRSQKFWSILIPIFISIGALAVSIISLYYSPPCTN